MPKANKDKIIGQEKKKKIMGYKYCCEKKDYKIVDSQFGSARCTVHVYLPISKYG